MPAARDLATIGGWGTTPGRLLGPAGVAVSPNGDVTIADWDNHRVEKFTPGVPGWVQTNVNGFGDRRAQWVSSVLPFHAARSTAAGFPRKSGA